MLLNKTNNFPQETIDPKLGKIIFRQNSRAKRIIIYTRPEAIYVTIPFGISFKYVTEVLNGFREKILQTKKKLSIPSISLSFEIKTDLLNISLVRGTKSNFFSNDKLIRPISSSIKGFPSDSQEISLCMLIFPPQTIFTTGKAQIICPSETDFSKREIQEWLHKVIEEILRKQARSYLPIRLQQLSKNHDLPFNNISIKGNRSNWGSCTSKKKINLSYFLMLLPSHLIDYILLHELCHTREMNHGEDFWTLLNTLTNDKALSLKKELRKYKTSF